MTGEPELGVILYEYDVQEGGVTCTGHQLYIAPDGTYIPYGDAAEDAANEAVLAAHRENVETLLSGPGRSGGSRDLRGPPAARTIQKQAARRENPGGPPACSDAQLRIHIVIEPIGEPVLRHRLADGSYSPAGQLVQIGKEGVRSLRGGVHPGHVSPCTLGEQSGVDAAAADDPQLVRRGTGCGLPHGRQTGDGLRPSREKSGQWVMTMFRRLGRGRPPGKESSVRRPRMTVPPRVRERKRFMSVGREKSRSLSRPMAQF